MGLRLAEAYVDIVIRRDKLNTGLAGVTRDLNRLGAASGVRGAGSGDPRRSGPFARRPGRDEAAPTRGGGGGSFLGGAARTAAGIGLYRGAAAIGSLPGKMFDAAKAAADLGESISKVGVTFGPAAGDVIGKTDELAAKFGVVKREALDAAAGFGLMGQASGMNKQQSAQLGNQFVQMGLDLASFHNITNQEAFEKLRSGLAGEIEPLRTIGILLSEDAVQAKALEMGLVSSAKAAKHLTQQQKVAARSELIASQMGPAAGDLERTKDSNANQLRKIQGDIENTITDFGKELQGALQSGVALAREMGTLLKGATGEETPKWFGGMAKASIDVARGVVGHVNEGGVGDNNIKTAGKAIWEVDKLLLKGYAVNAVDAMATVFGDSAGLQEVRGRLMGNMAESTAAGAGMKLSAPATTDAERQAARDRYLKDSGTIDRAKEMLPEGGLQGMMERGARSLGLFGGKERAAEQKRLELKRGAEVVGDVEAGASGLWTNLKGSFGAALEGLSADPATAAKGRAQLARNQVFGGGAGGVLMQGALAFGSSVAGAVGQGGGEPFRSQSFGDSADFSRDAIKTALSDPDTGERQLEEQQATNDHLKEAKEQLVKIATGMGKSIGVVLRGNS